MVLHIISGRKVGKGMAEKQYKELPIATIKMSGHE